MAKFVIFTNPKDIMIAVNIENIRCVIPYDDKITHIRFDENHVVAVKGNIHDIMHTIETAE